MNSYDTILLASGSPRRAYLLEMMGFSYRVVVSEVEETIPTGMKVEDVPKYLAKLKGQACLNQLKESELLLAADTVVILENRILGKPSTKEEAYKTLEMLSNQSHSVVSGVFLSDGKKSISFNSRSEVLFDEISQQEIDHYIEKCQPFDKAGSYGIQEEIGWNKIKRIEGSYSNIMGLPTHAVYHAVARF